LPADLPVGCFPSGGAMDTDTTTTPAIETPEDAWVRWQREHAEVLARGTGPQRILLEAAVRFVAVIAAQPILLRVAAFFLLHAGMGLPHAPALGVDARCRPAP